MASLAVKFDVHDGFQLFAEADMVLPITQPFTAGRVAVFSSRAPDGDGSNEDAAALLSLDAQRGVIAVADGVGGQPLGEQASQLALTQLCTACLDAHHAGTSLRDAILDGFERANRAVIDLGTGAATTLIAAEVDGGAVRTYHTGDSMILVVGQRGKMKLQTVSHSPVGYAVESGLLDEREAMLHENRHIVSNMIGDPTMRIEMGSSLELDARDTLVLASDGLFDNLHTEEIGDFVRTGPLEVAGDRLATAARARMETPSETHPSKPDDLTFALFRRAL